MTLHINTNISEFQRADRQGLMTHVMMMAHFVQKYTMDKLTGSSRYQALSLSYTGYISLLVEQDCSPGELAKNLGITKQACNKTVREMEKRGLLVRRKNPDDNRSIILSLSTRGLQLVYDGIKLTTRLQQQLADKIGTNRLEKLVDILEKLCRSLAIEIPSYHALEQATGKPVDSRSMRLSTLLPRLSSYLHQYLIDSLTQKGFEGLKPNFSQVLGLISHPGGGRIQHISSVVGISKQAVAVTALELEQQGYIIREPDSNDKRQIILRLSPMGQQLLTESTASVHALETSIKKVLSTEEHHHLVEAMATLYFQVADQYDRLGVFPTRIEQISQSLLAELGITEARTLAQQLMMITTRGTM